MRSRLYKILFFIICVIFSINIVFADTLKELKDELARDEANKSSLIKKQNDVQKNIKNAQGEISNLEKDIEKYEDEIEEILIKIDELTEEIKEKQEEIDVLLSFLQISSGDNIYLEYVFEAKTFTDFIYRSAVIEELTNYNDELIDSMYIMIEENKKLQIELKDKIAISEKSISKLEDKLKTYNVSLKDLENAHSDVESSIAERKKDN